jgi:tetratricopeptide (TPR) repeat protein
MNALAEARAHAEEAKRGWIALAFAELRLGVGDVEGARRELEVAGGLVAEIEADDDRFAPALALLRAELHVRDGEPAAAEKLLQAARRGLGDSHGVARWMLVETDLALGRLALAQGRLEVADEQLGEALRIGEMLAGERHVGLAPILLESGRLRRAQGELAGARALFERALALIERGAVAADVRRDILGELGRTPAG